MNGMTVSKVVNGETTPLLMRKPIGRKAGQQTRLNEASKFVMWDGEAVMMSPAWVVAPNGDIYRDTIYVLFGNSNGAELCHDRRLTTEELFNFLLDHSESKTFNFGYGFDYDVDNILWDIPKHKLAYLAYHGKCRHRIGKQSYEIRYVPRKTFSVTELNRTRDESGHIREKRGRSIRIDDVVSYFNTRYDKALRKYKIGSEAQLSAMAADKDNRQYFLWADIEHIKEYWRLELKLGVPLMEKLRAAVYGAGFRIGMWYGPGAIAKSALTGHHVDKYMEQSPERITDLALNAYAGGWFERFGMGYYIGPVFVPDINSAYPWGISQLPNLRNGRWRHFNNVDPKTIGQWRLALYHIRYSIPKGQRSDYWDGIPFPLFQRRHDGSIFHPMEVTNWYHTPEAALVVNDPYAEILEAWVFDDDGTYPFAWVDDMYMMRLAMQAEGSAAEWGMKLGLNSLYGSMAQRSGWNRTTRESPRWHQIEWAGLITSTCRAMVYPAAKSAIENGYQLLSIDTDSVAYIGDGNRSGVILPNGEGNQLGRWKMTEYSGILYIQNGVYWLRDMEGNWLPPKTRGISPKRLASVDAGFEALESASNFTLKRRMYMGFRHAIQGQWARRGEWLDDILEFHPQYSGTRKHISFACRVCAQGYSLSEAIHPCFIFQHPKAPIDSIQHPVPWRQPDRTAEMIQKWLGMITEEES